MITYSNSNLATNVIIKRAFISGIILLLVASAVCASRKERELRFRRLTIEQGLSQSSAYAIVQDDRGFIWIGTEDVLNRYDGYQFIVYKSDREDTNSLSNSYILTLYKDTGEVLWIGTEKGLNRFDQHTERFTRYFHDPENPSSISNDRVTAIMKDSKGVLWIGTDCGLNRFDPQKGIFVSYQKFPDSKRSINHNMITCLYEDSRGGFWVGTHGGGLDKFDRKRNGFTHYMFEKNDTKSLSDNYITCIYEDRNHVLWIGTENGGLNRFNAKTGTFVHYTTIPGYSRSISDNNVTTLLEDSKGDFWVGTNKGLDLFNRENNLFTSYYNDPNNPVSLNDNSIVEIMEDRDGALWIGTWAGGVSILNREMQQFIYYTLNPTAKKGITSNVRKIFVDKDDIIWAGTDGGGLSKIDRTYGTIIRYSTLSGNSHGLTDDRVYEILKDRDGVFWIGTLGGGLYRSVPGSGRFRNYRSNPDDSTSLSDDRIRAIVQDSSGILWIGTNGGGLNAFDPKTSRCVIYRNDRDDASSLCNDRIFSLMIDKSNTLWIGTFGGGLDVFDPQNGTFKHFTSDLKNPHSLSDDYVLSLFEDSRGIIWVGTVFGGLNNFDPSTRSFKHYTEKNGLPNNVIYCILEDNAGNLWMSTNRGLSTFNTALETFQNYDVSDGLQSNEFNTGAGFFNKKNGEMFFGGINGFNSFFPDSIKSNMRIPPVVITDFQIFNKSVPIGTTADGRTILSHAIEETEDIVLSYKDNVFSFDFVALNFYSSEKNQYAYIMEGLDRQWNYVGTRRYVSYSGLLPGRYVFKVKGSNNDGTWNEEGTSIQITILPPYWKTWWFILSVLSVCLIIVLSVLSAYINRLKKRKIEEGTSKVIADVAQVLEHGRATVYRRNLDSDTYEYIGGGIQDITGIPAELHTKSMWDKLIIKMEPVGDHAGMSGAEVFRRVHSNKVDNWVIDTQIRTPAGEVRWVRDMMTALRDNAGTCFGIFGIMIDITDRKLAEEQLQEITRELHLRNEEMKTDLDMAREIQSAMFAKSFMHFPSTVPVDQCALQFSHLYLPATTLAGDFYDIIPVSDHEIGIVICDVMGHGARASLLTFYLRGLIEELGPIAADNSLFMKRLNIGMNSIISKFYTGIFASVFYCVADIKKGTIRYTNAGHPAPFIMSRSKGTVTTLTSSNGTIEPAIGLLEDYTFSINESTIHDDDVVLLYTDGLYEVDNPEKEIFGRKRLMETVKSNISVEPDKLCDAVIKDINNFSNYQELQDDVCLVAMHVKHAKAV